MVSVSCQDLLKMNHNIYKTQMCSSIDVKRTRGALGTATCQGDFGDIVSFSITRKRHHDPRN